MSRTRVVFCAVLAAAIFISALSAEEAALTLDQAVALALARNPEVLAAQTRIEAARGRTLQLRSRPEPGLLASVEGLPIPGLKKEGDETEIHLGIEQTFEYPGKRSTRADLGRQGEEMAAADLDRVGLLLTARVKRAYWKAAFSGAAEGTADVSGGAAPTRAPQALTTRRRWTPSST